MYPNCGKDSKMEHTQQEAPNPQKMTSFTKCFCPITFMTFSRVVGQLGHDSQLSFSCCADVSIKELSSLKSYCYIDDSSSACPTSAPHCESAWHSPCWQEGRCSASGVLWAELCTSLTLKSIFVTLRFVCVKLISSSDFLEKFHRKWTHIYP